MAKPTYSWPIAPARAPRSARTPVNRSSSFRSRFRSAPTTDSPSLSRRHRRPIGLRCSFCPTGNRRSRSTGSPRRPCKLNQPHGEPMRFDRRAFLAVLAALAAPRPVRAATLTDAAGRPVTIPERVTRVFPSGPPAAILLYTLAPELLIGWPRANSAEERAFLLPDVGARPEVGRLTGRGNTANLETVIALKPDLILDVGYVDPTYVSLAERVQQQTGVPYALLDGHFDKAATTYRMLGELVGRREQAENLARYAEDTLQTIAQRIAGIAPEDRPRVYYARGPRGLETALGGSINVETIEFLGARNVAGARRGGLAQVSLEQVLAWN